MGLSKPVASAAGAAETTRALRACARASRSRIAAGALLLSLLVPFIPSASAQIPAPIAGAAPLDIHLFCPDQLLEPAYAGADDAECTLKDLSRDAVYHPDAGVGPGYTHTVFLETRAVNESLNASGWQVELTLSAYSMSGGQEVPFSVRAKATPAIDAQDYHFELIATYVGPGGYNKTMVVPFTAEVGPYDFALPSWVGSQSRKAGQDEVVVYTLAITNAGVYPDSYRFTINAPPDLFVTTPPNLFVPPGETRTTNISALTPHGKIYELGRNAVIGIKIQSVSGSGVYSSTATLNIRGPYVPAYWVPLLLVGLVSASVVVRGSREKAELRALERGRPKPVALTPRQAVLLAELRRTDKEAYEAKRRSLDSVYKERLVDYRAHRKERQQADAEEARQAKREFLAAKKARKEKRKEEKRAAKLARKQATIEAKAQKKEAKREAKLVKKKEKVLGKKRAKLEKERAKAEAREAKAAAKQARLDARAAKAAAREAKKKQP